MNAFITVRMDSGGKPRITVAGTRDYYHAQRRERGESTMTVDEPKITKAHAEAIERALQGILDDNAEAIEHAVEYGAILSASAGTRPVREATTAGETVPKRGK